MKDSTSPVKFIRKFPKVWPILQVHNVFVLPGIPKYFATKMPLIVKYFLEPVDITPNNRRIALNLEEPVIVHLLDEAVARYPTVKFGSYP